MVYVVSTRRSLPDPLSQTLCSTSSTGGVAKAVDSSMDIFHLAGSPMDSSRSAGSAESNILVKRSLGVFS